MPDQPRINQQTSRERNRTAFAREQRKTTNEFAQDVWQMLRNRKIRGQKFRREHPIGPYTVDFVCLDLKLIIEVDGKEHFTQQGMARDERRDRYLQTLGFEVLRIRAYGVIRDGRAVRDQIEKAIETLIRPSPPTPLPEAGRGEQE